MRLSGVPKRIPAFGRSTHAFVLEAPDHASEPRKKPMSQPGLSQGLVQTSILMQTLQEFVISIVETMT